MSIHNKGKNAATNALTDKVTKAHILMIKVVLGMTIFFPFFMKILGDELQVSTVSLCWYVVPAIASLVLFLSLFIISVESSQRIFLPYSIGYSIIFIVIAYLQGFHLVACMSVWLTMMATPLLLPTFKAVNTYNLVVSLMFVALYITHTPELTVSLLLMLSGLTGVLLVSSSMNYFYFSHKKLKEVWHNEMEEAKRETEVLMESLSVMVNYKDDKNTIVKANHAQVEFMAKPGQKKIEPGDNLFDFIPEKEALKYLEEDQSIIKNQQPITNVVDKYTLADGSIKYVRTDKFPILLKDKKPGVMTIGMDITAVKEAELRIKSSERRFRQMFEHAPVAVRIRDLKKGSVHHNKSFYYMFGIKPGTQVLPGDVVPDDERADQIAWDTNVDSTSGTVYRIQRYRTPSGKTLITKAMITTVMDDKNQPELIVSAWENITAQEEAKQQLEEFTENLQESNQALEAFAYAVSHDLREPLRMITGYMQLLERRYKDQLDERAQEFIYYAVDGAARMNGMITDLLQFSRVGRMYQKLSNINLNSVSQKVLWDLQVLIEEKKAKVNIGELPVVKANRTEMNMLFQNLIGNAIKYSKKDVPPVVDVSCISNGTHYYFKVQDNGIGIEKKNQEVVFALFHRLHGKEEYTGTGIGLAVCKKVVDKMNGKIWVESTPGKGSTFHFSLPKSTIENVNAVRSSMGAR